MPNGPPSTPRPCHSGSRLISGSMGCYSGSCVFATMEIIHTSSWSPVCTISVYCSLVFSLVPSANNIRFVRLTPSKVQLLCIRISSCYSGANLFYKRQTAAFPPSTRDKVFQPPISAPAAFAFLLHSPFTDHSHAITTRQRPLQLTVHSLIDRSIKTSSSRYVAYHARL